MKTHNESPTRSKLTPSNESAGNDTNHQIRFGVFIALKENFFMRLTVKANSFGDARKKATRLAGILRRMNPKYAQARVARVVSLNGGQSHE
jgi:hypothetical protein